MVAFTMMHSSVFFLAFLFVFCRLCVADNATLASSVGSALMLTGRTTLRLNETLVSANGQFALGYWHNPLENVDTGYNLAIWYAKVPQVTPVWMPKTNIILSSQAILSFSSSGILELRDGLTAVWNTSTKGMNATMVSILNTGNLVIYDKAFRILWQSFDQPTNTLLPTQQYSSASKVLLYSWKDKYNYSTGYSQYAFRWNTSENLELDYLTHWVPFVWYWRTYVPISPNAGNKTQNNPKTLVLTPRGEFQAIVAPNVTHIIGKSTTSTAADHLRRITLDNDGQVRMYSWQIGRSSNWTIEWAAVPDVCKITGWCGPFAVCSDGECRCLQGFDWMESTDKKKGCLRVKTPFYCNGTGLEVDDFISFPGDYPWGTDLRYFSKVSVEACQKECLAQCLCQGATTSSPPDAYGNVMCWLKSGTLVNGLYQSDRVSYVRMAPTVVVNKSNRKVMAYSTARLVIIILGALLAVFGMISCIHGWFWVAKMVKTFRLHKLREKLRLAHGTTVRYSYTEIQIITRDFSETIGKGGYGTVYKGEIVMDDLKVVVAVKQLDKLDQGVKTFITEVDVIGSIHHIHLLRLLGYCADAHHKVLVYEYMEKRSLDKLLFADGNSMPVLEWRPRFNIAVQTARGLAYLHDDIRDQRIVHCDVKPENILIDSTYSAKVADFGLSRILNREQSPVMTSHIRETCGYLAPEWTSIHTPITPKTDVYSFGMVLFEMISGHRNAKPLTTKPPFLISPSTTSSSDSNDNENGYFPGWAYSKFNEPNFSIFQVLDPALTGIANPSEVERMLKVAFWCIHDNHQLRPPMSKVVQMLEGHAPIALPLPQPHFDDKFSSDSNESPIIDKEIPM